MAENFVNILREIRGNTLAPATDRNCIYGDIKWMYGVIEGYQQITPEERLKLEMIEEEATKNSTDEFLLSRANHTGTMSMTYITDSSNRLAMTIDDKNKLDGIALGATKNASDSELINRATHTGVQSADTIVNGITNAAFTNVEKIKLAALDTTKPPVHSHNMNEITLGNLDASRITESSDKQFVTSTQKGRISGSEQAVNRGVPNGYVPLDGNGKVNSSYLNSLNLVDVFTVVDLDSMILISAARPGDIAYVESYGDTYMLAALPSSNALNWKKLNSSAGVISVNGLTGVISMSSDDLPEGLVNKYFTEVRENRLEVAETVISNANLTRADKYLAAQNIAKMIYDLEGNLLKVRYNNDVDVDYEVLTYSGENLVNLAHYVNEELKGNTVMMYASDELVSSIFIGV